MYTSRLRSTSGYCVHAICALDMARLLRGRKYTARVPATERPTRALDAATVTPSAAVMTVASEAACMRAAVGALDLTLTLTLAASLPPPSRRRRCRGRRLLHRQPPPSPRLSRRRLRLGRPLRRPLCRHPRSAVCPTALSAPARAPPPPADRRREPLAVVVEVDASAGARHR